MANRVQHLRHTSTALANFTGLEAEITVNLANNTVVVHDGITPGGHEHALATLANVNAATVSVPGKMTDQHVRDIAQALAATVSNAVDISLNETTIVNNLIAINNNAAAIAQNAQDISNLTGGQGAFLLISGGTMTGPIVLDGDPTANLEAATKQYTDSGDTTAESNAKTYADGLAGSLEASKVDRAGDTFTGPVILAGAPTQPQGAATKQFVESALSAALLSPRTAGDIACGYAAVSLAPHDIATRLIRLRTSIAGIYRCKIYLEVQSSYNLSGHAFLLYFYVNGALIGSPFSTAMPQFGNTGDVLEIVYDFTQAVSTFDLVDIRLRLTGITDGYNVYVAQDFTLNSAEAPVHVVLVPEPTLPTLIV